MRRRRALYLDININTKTLSRRLRHQRTPHITPRISRAHRKAAFSDPNLLSCHITHILPADTLPSPPTRTMLPRPPTTLLQHIIRLRTPAHRSGNLHTMATLLPIRGTAHSAHRPATRSRLRRNTLPTSRNTLPVSLKGTRPLCTVLVTQAITVAMTPPTTRAEASTHSKAPMVPRHLSIL